MDKLIDLFLKTPLAKRLTAGLVERVVILIVGVLAGWLKIDASAYQSDLTAFLVEFAPEAAAVIVLALIAVKRIKSAEVTIETARLAPPDSPRTTIDAVVKSMTKSEKNQALASAAIRADIDKARTAA